MCHRAISRPGWAVAIVFVYGIVTSLANAADPQGTEFHFLKPAGAGFAPESTIRLEQDAEQRVIRSVTRRGNLQLTLVSRFDGRGGLIGAQVTVQNGDLKQSASAKRKDKIAQIHRAVGEPRRLACPPAVIITSAPDWTDSFLAVRRYDARGERTQTFDGLWIHPTREPLRLKISLTRVGQNVVTRGNSPVTLERLTLVLRGGSRYVVWRNPQGELVRLIPAQSGGGIVLSGWERATRDLGTRR